METYNNKFNSYIRYGLIIIGIILFLLLLHTYNSNANLRTQLNISNQNAKALADSVRVSKNKVGDLEYSKNVLVSEKNELSNLNSDLKKELDKEKGKVYELTKYVASIDNGPVDGVPTVVEVYPDSTQGLKWKYEKIYDSENYRLIAGESKFKIDSLGNVTPLFTELTQDEIKFNVIQGLREKDGNIEMFVRSDYPAFKLDDLNSVIIDPKNHPVLKKFTKQKRFGIGPYVGYGVYINNFNGQVGLGAQIGIGIHYDIIKF